MERPYLKRWKQYITEDAHQNIEFDEGSEYDVYDHDQGDWVSAQFVGYNSDDEDYVFKLKFGQNSGRIITIPYEYGDNDIRRMAN